MNNKDEVTRAQLEDISPALSKLTGLETSGKVAGVILTTKGEDKEHNFISRFFAPWLGVAEDPVTGSAHTVLAPYWSRELGLSTMQTRQCSPRGGELEVSVSGERVEVAGKSIIVMEGYLTI